VNVFAVADVVQVLNMKTVLQRRCDTRIIIYHLQFFAADTGTILEFLLNLHDD